MSESDNETYEVERIEKAKVFKEGGGRIWKYFVKWKGYDTNENTWEPVSSFADDDLINEFWLSADTRERDWSNLSQFDPGEEIRKSTTRKKPSEFSLSTGSRASASTPRQKRRYAAHVSDPESEEPISPPPKKPRQSISQGIRNGGYERQAQVAPDTQEAEDVFALRKRRRSSANLKTYSAQSRKQRGKQIARPRFEDEDEPLDASHVEFAHQFQNVFNTVHNDLVEVDDSDGPDNAEVARTSKVKPRPSRRPRSVARRSPSVGANHWVTKSNDGSAGSGSSRSVSVEIVESTIVRGRPRKLPKKPALAQRFLQEGPSSQAASVSDHRSSPGKNMVKKSRAGPGRNSALLSDIRPEMDSEPTPSTRKSKGKRRAVVETDEGSEGHATGDSIRNEGKRKVRSPKASSRMDIDDTKDNLHEKELAKRAIIREREKLHQQRVMKATLSRNADDKGLHNPTGSKRGHNSHNKSSKSQKSPSLQLDDDSTLDLVPTGLLDTDAPSPTVPSPEATKHRGLAVENESHHSASGADQRHDESSEPLFLDSPEPTSPQAGNDNVAPAERREEMLPSPLTASRPAEDATGSTALRLPGPPKVDQPRIPAHRNKVPRVKTFDTVPRNNSIPAKARATQPRRNPSTSQGVPQPTPPLSSGVLSRANTENEVIPASVSPSPGPDLASGNRDESLRTLTPPPPNSLPFGGPTDSNDGTADVQLHATSSVGAGPGGSDVHPELEDGRRYPPVRNAASESAQPAHRQHQTNPRVRTLPTTSVGKNEPAGRSIGAKQRAIAQMSRPGPLGSGSSNAKVTKTTLPRRGGSLLTFNKGSKAGVGRGVVMPRSTGKPIVQSSLAEQQNTGPFENSPDKDNADMASLFSEPDETEADADVGQVVPTGEDILKAHGLGVNDTADLPDFNEDDAPAPEVPISQENVATTIPAPQPPSHDVVNSLFGNRLSVQPAPVFPVSPITGSSRPMRAPAFSLRLDTVAYLHVALHDLHDDYSVLEALGKANPGVPGKLYEPPAMQVMVGALAKISGKVGVVSSARVERDRNSDDEKQIDLWQRFRERLENNGVFVELIEGRTFAVYSSGNGLATQRFNVHPSLLKSTEAILITPVDIVDGMAYANAAVQAANVKW
ncbi:hypothetical protein PUNSTDRAFT_127058 [Punctularia strigosozonata HHB-11173 SS5]|uniref:uncharacterized protein n=1 Tax=Punctularia strigosozonata (strain HHB-11173) TaxID=741275 RepID=UPI0004418051|nr:uncharacterized protein PUNSTDRAFT_127058 [Punctularia strigosozonata HHB-11173 SS5]EIN07286.1 hypothetical protein PUNSTDRAFT_127058 [Punctularia strigosozonata HHB-11173 SS5]